VAGCCEQGYELWVSIKCREFLDKARNCRLLKKDPAAWSSSVSLLLTSTLGCGECSGGHGIVYAMNTVSTACLWAGT
jgi:hypothetical protein